MAVLWSGGLPKVLFKHLSKVLVNPFGGLAGDCLGLCLDKLELDLDGIGGSNYEVGVH